MLAVRHEDRDVIVRTERLVLTSWVAADVPLLHRLHSDPETMRFIRFGRPETLAETADLVGQSIAQHQTRGWTKWRLATHDGDLVGRAGFGGDDDRRGLSFAIDRRLWGRGLATEVASALVRWHWEHAAEVGLRAVVEMGNDASVAVLKKVGFEHTGTEAFGESLCLAFIHRGSHALG